jgi:putative sigma-54 modulation protein
MNLRLVSRKVELTAPMREYISRRIHFALGRYARAVKSVSVHLTDVNGSRGGVDKRCIVNVETGARNAVLIRETQPSVFAAISIAAQRAGRALQRQLELTRMPHTRLPPRRLS